MSQSWDSVAEHYHAQYMYQLVQCACADESSAELCVDHTLHGQEQLLKLIV